MAVHSDSWRDAFASFAARKTRAARLATTPPYVTVIDAPDHGLSPVVTPWSESAFGGPFYVRDPADPARPACSLVFVQSADGNTGARDPASLGGGETDHHVVYEGLSRVAADAVLVGASTLHGQQAPLSVWRQDLIDLRRAVGLPRHPTQIVATLSGVDLESGLIFNAPDIPVILLTSAAGAAAMDDGASRRPWIRLVIMRARNGLVEAFTALRADGIRRISCVGGRTLARALLDASLVDDLYLTTARRTGGEPDTPLSPRALAGTIVIRKRGTGHETGVVFEHLRLSRTPGVLRHPVFAIAFLQPSSRCS